MTCETCDQWYHAGWQNIHTISYQQLGDSELNISWYCIVCNNPNYSSTVHDYQSIEVCLPGGCWWVNRTYRHSRFWAMWRYVRDAWVWHIWHVWYLNTLVVMYCRAWRCTSYNKERIQQWTCPIIRHRLRNCMGQNEPKRKRYQLYMLLLPKKRLRWGSVFVRRVGWSISWDSALLFMMSMK
jgi:hypothetical protein